MNEQFSKKIWSRQLQDKEHVIQNYRSREKKIKYNPAETHCGTDFKTKVIKWKIP